MEKKIKSKNGKFISSAQDLFSRHTIKSDGCWEWGGYKNATNYGFTRVGGRGSKGVLAHRLSWQLHFGEIPEGMHVCHKCDNPPCVRPDHLFLGTNLDNIKDRIKKGRSSNWIRLAKRDDRPNTKIKSNELPEVLRLSVDGVDVGIIANQFNISIGYAKQLISKLQKNGLQNV